MAKTYAQSTQVGQRTTRLLTSMNWKAPPKVLIVDDDKDLLALIAPVLSGAGLAVTTASTGWDALKILENEGVDLIITDVVLPGGLSGVELVIYARARYPELKSLFISGHSDPNRDDPDRDDFVAKPFRPEELLGCVYALLVRQRCEDRTGAPLRAALRAIVEAKIACLKQQRQGETGAAPLEGAGGTAVVGTGSILVVDDDPDVLEIATVMIEDLGFTVLRAGGGAEALQLLEANSNIMLLVTDVVMPGMNGWALARESKQRRPDLKVIYVSGFIKNLGSLPAEEYGPILPKPWRSHQFSEIVSQILADC